MGHKIFKAFFLLLTVAIECSCLYAQNPVVTGFSDPAMRVFNGRMYLVVGRDKGPETKGFQMPYWAILSSADLRDWKVECYIDPADTYLGAGYMNCWAADINFKDDKVYFYCSNGGEETGVFVAEKPSGPFVDVLKKPLLPRKMSTNHEYDPTAFTDDDGQRYIILGRDGQLKDELLHYQIAKFGNDMLSLAEPPHDLLTSEPYGFGAKNAARDHSYFHKYNGTYYLSCAGVYMTSSTVYGPFSNPRKTGQDQGHSSFSEFNGQTYHAWEWTCDPFGNRAYRQVMLTYLHYKDNGDMVDDMNFAKSGKYYANGVGNYSAKWDTIQAEWYFRKSENAKKKESPAGGFEVQNLRDNDYLNFPYMKDVKANTVIHFLVSSKNEGCKIEIRQDSPTGPLLGTCSVPGTGAFTKYENVSCSLKNAAGTLNLYFVFKGEKDDLAHLDWFNF